MLTVLLAKGWEWPDATAKAAMEFNVTVDALTNEYDEQLDNEEWLAACSQMKRDEGQWEDRGCN